MRKIVQYDDVKENKDFWRYFFCVNFPCAEDKDSDMSLLEILEEKYGAGVVQVEMIDSYCNMREMIGKKMHIVDNMAIAMEQAGVVPKISAIRGGTDGARLSFDGLLCPNICTGSEGHHGRNEFACVEDMEKIVEIILNNISITAQKLSL